MLIGGIIVLFIVWSSVKPVHLKLYTRNTDFIVSVSEMVVIFFSPRSV